MSGKQPIYVDDVIVGHVHDAAFKKRVRASAHQLRKPRAWALDEQSLRDAEAAGAERVELFDTETGRTYCASIETIWRNGRAINRGWGWQIYLLLRDWTDGSQPEPETWQPSLFDVLGVPA